MSRLPGAFAAAGEIALGVREGAFTAVSVAEAALARIAALDPGLTCFTTVTADRALREAAMVDAYRAAGRPLGPLAGVPFAVKDLYDIAGIPTLAGSRIRAEAACPERDATAVSRLGAAGGVLLGALNMDEFAYGFSTENAHYGITRNPHDPERIAGGSSGGSAASVAAGLVAGSLGTDTNGSIRVPASLCGVFGLKPTYGRLSRVGVFPFVGSLDHVGPFARSVAEVALFYDAMLGPDPSDPAQGKRPAEPVRPTLDQPFDPKQVRMAVLGGYFEERCGPEVLGAVAAIADALGARQRVELPEAARARAAAYLITAAEGGALHLPDLKVRPEDYDAATRDRLRAGALVPAVWVQQAQRFRRWYRDQVAALFATVDILLTAATPCQAPLIGQQSMVLNGVEMPVRANLGLLTQPISFIGLPVLTVPAAGLPGLPIGVQLIGAPWSEGLLLRIGRQLERDGVVQAPMPPLPA